MFALGASLELMLEIGINNIQERALALNRYLTERLAAAGQKILSPIGDESARSAETLVEFPDPPAVVARLSTQGVVVTEKPQGIRVATDFFNNEADIDRLIDALTRITTT
jgi:selenocysteine lyase/cysteine desulfurase